jgi:hypothetical protein
MPKKQIWLVAILMLASAIVGGITSNGLSLISQVEAQRKTTTKTAAQPPPIHRYEYQFYIAAGPKDLTDQANKLAEDGWEMTQVITDERLITRYIGYFRRQKQ